MDPTKRLEDRRLVTRMRRGDETALDELVARFGPLILDTAVRRLSNREDAEEVAQDVLFTAWRKIGQFRQDAALSSWIYRITFNTVMSRLRARLRADPLTRAQPLEIPDAEPEGRSPAGAKLPDRMPLADELLARTRTRRMLVRALTELPPPVRRALVLHHAYDLPLREVAARLAEDPKPLRKRLFRGRMVLRTRLDAQHAEANSRWRRQVAGCQPYSPSTTRSASSAITRTTIDTRSAAESGGVPVDGAVTMFGVSRPVVCKHAARCPTRGFPQTGARSSASRLPRDHESPGNPPK